MKCVYGCDKKYKAKGLCVTHYGLANNAKWRSSPKGRTYHVWYSMIWRCNQKTGYCWEYYGSRGITVCDRWRAFDNFIEDMGYQPMGLTIERIDNSKGYSPDNCAWKTRLDNYQNRRNSHFVTIGDETLTVSAWARRVGVKRPTANNWVRVYGDNYFKERIKSLLLD